MTPWCSGRATSMLSGTRPNISRASWPTATIFCSSTAIATMVGSCISTWVLSARRVNMVPRSTPRSFENAATDLLLPRESVGVLAIAADDVQAQVRAAQGRFHVQQAVLVLRRALGEDLLGA